MDNPEITSISYFSGYAGIDIALSRIFGNRLRTIAFCEGEAWACANLIAKMEAGLLDAAPIWTDVGTFPYGDFYGLVDIAHGGVPCQPHSLAGKRAGGHDERFLFDTWIDGLAIMQPRQIFIENVLGLLSSKMPDGTLCIRHVLRRLEEIGYCVEDDQGRPLIEICSAAECGASHRRQRVFILAVLADSMRGPGSSEHGQQHCERGEVPGTSSEPLADTKERDRGSEQPAGEQAGNRGSGFTGGSSPLALPTWRGQRELRESSGPDRQPDGCDEGMANTESGQDNRRGQGIMDEAERSRGSGNPAARIGSEDVLDRRDGQAVSRSQRPQGDSQGGPEARTTGRGSGAEMEHSESQRAQSAELTGCGNGSIASSLPKYPPRPSDIEGWRRVLEIRPDLAPAIETIKPVVRLLADGSAGKMGRCELSTRNDQLRALGNGVVPSTAELAYRLLTSRLQK